MATHFLDYPSVEGRVSACGRFFDNCKPMPRGVVITTDTAAVSCQSCIATDRLRIARARRPRALDDPRPLSSHERGAK